jgi:hypothetical protein
MAAYSIGHLWIVLQAPDLPLQQLDSLFLDGVLIAQADDINIACLGGCAGSTSVAPDERCGLHNAALLIQFMRVRSVHHWLIV